MGEIFDLDVEYDGLDTPERDSIEREGKDNAELDFGDSIYKGIEEMNKLVNQQTPVGMSVNNALAHFGGRIRSELVPQKLQVIVDMMNDDEILEVMDELEDFIR